MINPIIKKDIESIVRRLGKSANDFSGRTVLITGASGLIGGYILETIAYLNSEGSLSTSCKIIGLQKNKVTKKGRFGYLLNRSDIEFVSHNAARKYIPGRKVDFIIHSAGDSAPASFLADPLGTIDVNVKGIRWILEYAKKNGSTSSPQDSSMDSGRGKVKSVLYMSSGEIYGNPTPENIPTPETYNGNVSTQDPRSCYTSSKRLAETLCRIYFEKFKVPVKIARPFIVYGPGLSSTDKRVMAQFIKSGLEKKPIEMMNEGRDTRSYCYVADATLVFLKILLSDRNGEVFNVASDREEVSIRDLADLVHEICGIKKPVKIRKMEGNFIKGAPNRVRPDISKIKKEFGFNPEIGIRKGLTQTIEWNKTLQ